MVMHSTRLTIYKLAFFAPMLAMMRTQYPESVAKKKQEKTCCVEIASLSFDKRMHGLTLPLDVTHRGGWGTFYLFLHLITKNYKWDSPDGPRGHFAFSGEGLRTHEVAGHASRWQSLTSGPGSRTSPRSSGCSWPSSSSSSRSSCSPMPSGCRWAEEPVSRLTIFSWVDILSSVWHPTYPARQNGDLGGIVRPYQQY